MYQKLLSLSLVVLTILCTSISPVQAGYAPVAPNILVAGRTFSDLSNLIILTCTARGNDTCTMRKSNGNATSGYQVTAGKTLKLSAFVMMNTGNLAQGLPLYSDNDGGLAQSGVGGLTNPVYYNGFTSSDAVLSLGSAVAGYGNKEYNVYFEVPAAKYPGFHWVANSALVTIIAYGYEE